MHLQSQRLWAAAVAALLLSTACAQALVADTTAVAEQIAPPSTYANNPACDARPQLFLNPRLARQGATLQLVPAEPVGAYAPREIVPEFVTGWTATPAGQVTISKDGKSMTVAETATPGAEVTVSANYCDRPFSRTIRIIGKTETVIAGMWHQESIACTGETPTEPVREFDLSDRGEFSITYAPFESYRDFWGKADFSSAAGTLMLTTTGGNRVPSDARLSGKANLTPDGKLVLDGFFLSQPQTTGGLCTYTFAK